MLLWLAAVICFPKHNGGLQRTILLNVIIDGSPRRMSSWETELLEIVHQGVNKGKLISSGGIDSDFN